jgi:hypothetical protein
MAWTWSRWGFGRLETVEDMLIIREVDVERRTDDRATPTRDESVLQNYLRGVQWLADVQALHQGPLSHVPCAPDRIT